MGSHISLHAMCKGETQTNAFHLMPRIQFLHQKLSRNAEHKKTPLQMTSPLTQIMMHNIEILKSREM